MSDHDTARSTKTATSAAVEHKMAMDAIGFAFQLLGPQKPALSALVEAERGMHSYLHITDPTMYIKALNDKGLHQQVHLAKAALAFIAVVEGVKSGLADG